MIREIKREDVIKNFDKVRLSVASPDNIRRWSYGEVVKPDTLNYRTLKPEKGGLFCERIFGPEKDYECSCGKYKKKRFEGQICDRCGVEITTSRVRRSRMGHIELATDVAHIWFTKSLPSVIGTLLDITVRKLERVLYYESYIVIDPGKTDYDEKDLIDIDEYYDIKDRITDDFVAMIGAEAVKVLLSKINLESESMDLRARIKMETAAQKKQKSIKRLKIVDAFRKSKINPEWMILEVLPVLPPTLRPLVQLEGGRFATADFNELYRRVITRNNRLRGLIDINAPEVILRNEKRMLQEAVDALIDNSRKTRPVKGRGNRALKALADQLKGKTGRFRQNLLGKRVDYSGRSVITVGPELQLHQCGLPKDMAIELFKPFLIERLEKNGDMDKGKTAKRMIEKKQPEIWEILEDIIKDYPVLLNRAPTLHKHGIQAFMPVLIENKAIQLHPLVCIPYNADFDGDQMAIHVPLSNEARMEARVLMLASRNLLLPSNGKLAMATNQDIVLGNYYLTVQRIPKPEKDEEIKKLPRLTYDELLYRLEYNEFINNVKGEGSDKRNLDIHDWIIFYTKGQKVITTVGRAIFNSILPPELPFKNYVFTKAKLNEVAMEVFHAVGQHKTANFLDRVKEMGFKYSTRSGITFSADDVIIPKQKDAIIKNTESEVAEIVESYQRGEITETERYNRVVDKWKMATEDVTSVLMKELTVDQNGFNPINMMYISGARGGKDQIKQLGAMRGLMDKPSKGTAESTAEVIETPIKSNFKEGLSILEYFISTHGARKGLADTALKTADAGYLTRRLVDVAQNAIITQEDCGTTQGLDVSALKEGLEIVEPLSERIKGRTAAEDIMDPQTEEETILVEAGEAITDEMALLIQKRGIDTVKIRSVLTCEAERGICAKCYGKNLATQKPVTMGEPVGVIAAQSIGEPGTQLTLRTFHIGGAASTEVDVAEVTTQNKGIVKYERLNTVTNREDSIIAVTHKGKIHIIDEESGESLESYKVGYASTIYVKSGDKVVKGTRLFSWDPYNDPLIATSKGRLVLDNFIPNITYKEEFNEMTGFSEKIIIEPKDKKIQPQFIIVDDETSKQTIIPVPKGLNIDAENGAYVYPGDILGKSSKTTIKQGDITGGLPRVQEFFEARVPQNKAVVTEIEGTVTIGNLSASGRIVYVKSSDGTEKKYVIPPGKRIIVHEGDILESGDPLSDGQLDPHDILKAKGITEAQQLIVNEVQEVYRKQGVKIDDKHLGVIIRQMFKKVKIINPGDTIFLEGEIADRVKVKKENREVEKQGGEGAKFEQLLLGITKASLLTESWLSSASFQETTKILTQSSISGKVDELEGLKESIIIGHRIPVGTGTKLYNEKVNRAVEEGKSLGEIISEFAHTQEEDSDEDLLNY